MFRKKRIEVKSMYRVIGINIKIHPPNLNVSSSPLTPVRARGRVGADPRSLDRWTG